MRTTPTTEWADSLIGKIVLLKVSYGDILARVRGMECKYGSPEYRMDILAIERENATEALDFLIKAQTLEQFFGGIVEKKDLPLYVGWAMIRPALAELLKGVGNGICRSQT